MKKITSILVVLLLLLALAGQLYSMALYNELRDSVIFLTKQTLHRWLAIRDRLEEVGEDIQVMIPVESMEEASESITESETEAITEAFTETAADDVTVTEPSETSGLAETTKAYETAPRESTNENAEVTEDS